MNLTFGTKSLYHGSVTVDAANAERLSLSRSLERLRSIASEEISIWLVKADRPDLMTLEMYAGLWMKSGEPLQLCPCISFPFCEISALSRNAVSRPCQFDHLHSCGVREFKEDIWVTDGKWFAPAQGDAYSMS